MAHDDVGLFRWLSNVVRILRCTVTDYIHLEFLGQVWFFLRHWCSRDYRRHRKALGAHWVHTRNSMFVLLVQRSQH